MAVSEGFSLPLSDDWSEAETSFEQSPPVGFCLDTPARSLRPYSSGT
jgi:hypothetical protein